MNKIVCLTHLQGKMTSKIASITLMRIFLLFISIGLGAVYANPSYAQTKISIDANGITYEELFDQIQGKSEFVFFYKDDVLNSEKKVFLNIRKAKLSTILDRAFHNTDLDYSIDDRQVVITKKDILIETGLSLPIILQDFTISGTITDKDGTPLPGANILEKDTTNGTQADFDGKFSLEVADENAILSISYIGFATQEVETKGQTNLNIVLEESAAGLEEVVVVGYGTQKKVNLTGAVGQVDNEALENKPVVNVQEVLQGKVPGLNITNNSGRPGSGANINIRGTSTIGGSSGVLVIIDGIPGNIFTLNPNDIESISVLKDAASAAIYGARAANGVILVTTKSAKGVSDLKVSLTAGLGVQRPQHYIDFVGGKDFMELFNLARTNDGLPELYTQDDFNALERGDLPDHQWNREIFKTGQLIQNNYLSLSGGNERLNTRVGISYDKQSGALPRDKYKRLVVHPKLTYKFNDWLSIDANVQYTKTNIERPQGGDGPIAQSLRISPITPIRTPQGRFWGPGGIPGGNPIAVVNEGGTDAQEFKELSTILFATITPVEGWNIKPFYSHYSSQTQTHNFTKPIALYNTDETIFSQDPLSNQNIFDAFGKNTTEILQLSTDYSFTLNEDHNFTLLGLASQEVNEGDDFSASRLDPAFDNIYVLDIGVGTKDNSGFAFNESIASLVGRLNYNYKQKYLFEASIRRDGTSRFKDGYRWGTFPSFSAGWNVAQEKFIQDNLGFLSQLKIRASWGELGDALKVGRYETRNILGFTSGIYAFDGSLVGGAAATASFLDDLSWERSIKSNLGFDIGLFNQKITMSLDLFKDLRDQILYRSPVPDEYGLSAPFTNALELENKGFEFLVSYNENLGDFSFNVDFNLANSKNKVLDLQGSGPWIGGRTITEVGKPLELPYGLQSDGLFQSQTNINDSATQVNVQPGNIKYVDQNGDGTINADGDRVVLNDKTPFIYGFNLGARYKNLSLSASFYGRHRAYRYIESYEGWAFFISNNVRPMHLDNWTPDNPDASYPRLSLNSGGNDTSYSDYWLRKADYLKLQNLTLAYKLPKQLIDVVGVDNATISLVGQNLAIFSNYDGFDPEGGNYPLPRTITMSLQLNF